MIGGFLISRPPVLAVHSKFVLTINGDQISVFDSRTGDATNTLDAHGSVISSICSFTGHDSDRSKDSTQPQILSASIDGELSIWNVTSARNLHTHKLKLEDQHILLSIVPLKWTDPLNSGFAMLTTRPSGCGGEESCVYIITVSMDGFEITVNSNIIRRFKGVTLRKIATSASGKYIGVISLDQLSLFHIPAGRWMTLNFNVPLNQVAIHPQDECVVVADNRGALQTIFSIQDKTLFDEKVDFEKDNSFITLLPNGASTNPPSRALHHWHSTPVRAMNFTPTGYLLTGGREAVLVQWHLTLGRSQFLPRIGAPIEHLAVSPDGTKAVLSLSDNSLAMVDLTGPKLGKYIRGVMLNPKIEGNLNADPILTVKLTNSGVLSKLDSDLERKITALDNLTDAPHPALFKTQSDLAIAGAGLGGRAANKKGLAYNAVVPLLVNFPGITDTLKKILQEDGDATTKTSGATADAEIALAANSAVANRRDRQKFIRQKQSKHNSTDLSNNENSHLLSASLQSELQGDNIAIVTAGTSAQVWSLNAGRLVASLPVSGSALGGAQGGYVSTTDRSNVRVEWIVECMAFSNSPEGLLLITAETKPPVLPELRHQFAEKHNDYARLSDQAVASSSGSEHCIKIFLVEDAAAKAFRRHQEAPSARTAADINSIKSGVIPPGISLQLLAKIEHAHENTITGLLPSPFGGFISVSADSRIKVWNKVKQEVEIPDTEKKGVTTKSVQLSWKCETVLSQASQPCLRASSSRDNSLVAITHSDAVSVWSPSSSSLLGTFTNPVRTSKSTRKLNVFIASIVIETPSGAAVIAATQSSLIAWDLMTATPIWIHDLPSGSKIVDLQVVPASSGSSTAFVAVVNNMPSIHMFGINSNGTPIPIGQLSRRAPSPAVQIVSALVLPPAIEPTAALLASPETADLCLPRVASLHSDLGLRVAVIKPSENGTEALLAMNLGTVVTTEAPPRISVTPLAINSASIFPPSIVCNSYLDSVRGVSILDSRVNLISRVHSVDAPSHLAPGPNVLCRSLLRAASVSRPPLVTNINSNNEVSENDSRKSIEKNNNEYELIGNGMWSLSSHELKALNLKKLFDH